MARRFPSFLLVLALAGAPTVADALPISILEVERAGETDASAAAGEFSDFDSIRHFEDGLGGLSWNDVVRIGITGGAVVEASPGYRGFVSADEIQATAVARVEANAVSDGAFALGSAEVRQRIVFEATKDTILRLSGVIVAHQEGVSGDAVSILEITSRGGVGDPSPLLIQRRAEPGEDATFDLDFFVRSGMTYQILSIARASADALDLERSFFYAGFLVEVTEVPEPGTATLLLLGALALGARRARG